MGSADLGFLLKNMKPELKEGKFYFASVDESYLMNLAGYLDYIKEIYREEEGLSIVFLEDLLDEIKAICNKEPVGPFALISLSVNSDLNAVGFLAKILPKLAEKGISVNAISAFHHDHLFVPYEKKEKAMDVLKLLSG